MHQEAAPELFGDKEPLRLTERFAKCSAVPGDAASSELRGLLPAAEDGRRRRAQSAAGDEGL